MLTNNKTSIIQNWIKRYDNNPSTFIGRSIEVTTNGELYPDDTNYQSLNERPEVDELELIKDRELVDFPY